MFVYKDLTESFATEVQVKGMSFYLRLVKHCGKTDIVVYSDKVDEDNVLCERVFTGKTAAVKEYLNSIEAPVADQDKTIVKVGFARVSTVEQSLDLQIAALKKAGVAQDNLFASKHSGKAETNKAALDELMQRVKLMIASKLGVEVVVTKLDRLGRSMSQMLSVIEELKELGAHLVVLEQGIDTRKDDMQTKIMLNTLLMVAEIERGFIYERTQGARKAIGEAANGGRPSVVSKDDGLMERIETLLKQGMNKKAVAKECGIGRATLYRLLENK